MAFQPPYHANGNQNPRVDVADILARNRQAGAKDAMDDSRAPKPPGTGLLSQTMIQSPMVQWVVPCRIRHQDRNDVVFVGNNFIQIKELVSNGDPRYLEEVITKADFDAKIVGAKAISARQEEVGLDDQIRFNAEGRDEDVAMTEGVPEHSPPPEILVLVLSSKELLFTYVVESALGDLEFVSFRRPLPADVSALEEYGRHICVDPRSRAMAISAAQKFFGIFALKPPSLLQEGMKKQEVRPIMEERFFRTQGDILMMDFLHPTAHDNERAILLLLVSKDSATHIVCYDWRTSEGLRYISIKSIGREVPRGCALPSVLVPLKKTTSFLLVGPFNMYIFKNILEPEGGEPPEVYPVTSMEGEEDPTRTKLWTFWARPIRNTKYFDYIFLCREDGKSLYLEIGSDSEIQRQTQPGPIGCSVDTAFAIIDGGYRAGDLIVAVGSMSGGGLFIIDARQPPRCVQRIPNWGPILDSLTVRATDPQSHSDHLETGQVVTTSYDRLFVCSGIGAGWGSITELRYGVEARIGLMIDQDEASSIMDVWAIPNFETGGTFLLLSDPLSSSLICVPVDADEVYEVDEESSGLELGARTLATAATADGVVIQVTDSSINLSVIGNQRLRYSSRCQDPTERIIAAAVNGASSLICAATRRGDRVRLEIWRVEANDNGIQCFPMGEPLTLTQELVCLAVADLNCGHSLFIGTSDGEVLTGLIKPDGPISLSRYPIAFPEGNTDSPACETLSIITAGKPGRRKHGLFCGLRGGNLVSFSIEAIPDSSSPELKQITCHKLGDTPVRVRGYEFEATFAVASCGRGLWRLSHVESDSPRLYTIEKIWVTDQNNPARMQPVVDVFTLVEPQPHARPGGLGGSLICITNQQLLACTLETISKPVPRHAKLPGLPRRLIYSEYLKRLVVAYSALGEIEPGPDIRMRMTRPRIAFIDPDDESAMLSLDVGIGGESDDSDGKSRMPSGASGEKMSALLDWQFTHGESVYHMIVVGTGHPKSKQGGRLIYYTARPSTTVPGKIDSALKYVYSYQYPVRGIAAYKPSSLVIAVGKEIILQSLDPSTKRWRKLPAYKMESEVVSVTVREPYIYILTSRHSLCILKVNETCLSLYGQHGYERSGINHINLADESKIIMTSNRGGAIVGVTDIGLTPEEKLVRAVFAAHIPLSVVRLSRSFKQKCGPTSQIIYGTTVDGAVYRFTTISEQECKLLRFIQNLCTVDPTLCPTFARRRRNTAIDGFEASSSTNKPELMHVNGDILTRLVSRGVSHLQKLVTSETIGAQTSGSRVGNPPQDGSIGLLKTWRFNDFSEPIVGDVPNRYETVMLWLEDILRIEL